MNKFKILSKCFKNLRLKSQFLLITTFLIGVIFIETIILSHVHNDIISQIFTDSSSSIFSLSSHNQIAIQLDKYESYFLRLFSINSQTLISLAQLYSNIKNLTKNNQMPLQPQFNMNYGGTNNIPSIILINQNATYNQSYSFLCYTNKTPFSDPLTYDQYINIKVQESLQAYGPIIYNGKVTFQGLLSCYIENSTILMTYPCYQRFDLSKYNPLQRPWYQTLTNNYNNNQPYANYNYSFTNPYICNDFILQIIKVSGTSSAIGISLTLPFVDENLQFQGGAAHDYVTTSLVQQIQYIFGTDQTVILLATNNGTLIMHPYSIKPNQIPLYFYNETITGFNLTTWNLINNDNNLNNNCSQSTLLNYKCVYNLNTSEVMLVQVRKLYQFNFTLILMKNSKSFYQFQNEFLQNFISQMLKLVQWEIIEQLILFICGCLFIIIFTTQMFYPLKQIMMLFNSQIKQSGINNVLEISEHLLTSIQIQDLYESCINFLVRLKSLSLGKSENCLIIQNIQYPQSIFKNYLSFFIEKNKKHPVNVTNICQKTQLIKSQIKQILFHQQLQCD